MDLVVEGVKGWGKEIRRIVAIVTIYSDSGSGGSVDWRSRAERRESSKVPETTSWLAGWSSVIGD